MLDIFSKNLVSLSQDKGSVCYFHPLVLIPKHLPLNSVKGQTIYLPFFFFFVSVADYTQKTTIPCLL